MTLNQHSISRDEDEEILREKMTYDLFIQVDNPNLNIIQNNEAINRVAPPSLSLVLANIITRITSNEIQASCIIKRRSLRKMVCWILLHILPIGDNIN